MLLIICNAFDVFCCYAEVESSLLRESLKFCSTCTKSSRWPKAQCIFFSSGRPVGLIAQNPGLVPADQVPADQMAGLGLVAAAKNRGFGPAQGFIGGLCPRFLLALLFRVISEHAVPVVLVCNSCLGYYTAFNKSPWTAAIPILLDALLFVYAAAMHA